MKNPPLGCAVAERRITHFTELVPSQPGTISRTGKPWISGVCPFILIARMVAGCMALLIGRERCVETGRRRGVGCLHRNRRRRHGRRDDPGFRALPADEQGHAPRYHSGDEYEPTQPRYPRLPGAADRSEERRVGKE